MKGKNRDKDRWLGAVCMPSEGVFARLNKRARYRGVGKNGFQVSMQALAFNLKRLIRLVVPPLSGIVAEPIPLIAD
jgi:IS5 family transposase